MNNKEIGQRIRDQRNRLGMSQQELAEAVGYTSKVAISRIEAGQINIPMDKMARIAKCLDVRVSDLLSDKRDYMIGNTLFTFDTTKLSEEHQKELQRIAEVMERTELWQQQRGTEKDGGSELQRMGIPDPSLLAHQEEKDAKK